MSAIIRPLSATMRPSRTTVFENGDHLDQPTFHARYGQMPPTFRAQLIGGIVYVPSPLKIRHGDVHGLLMMWLNLYRARTPQTQALDNVTVILGPESEPQPDGSLIIKGGQTRVEEEYLIGPPELVAEVASTSESYDMFDKRVDYERHGVGEYLVLVVREGRILWFMRPAGQGSPFIEQPEPADRIHRSTLFPGLWLDPVALLRGEASRVIDVLNQGLATPEHAAFVARLVPASS